MASKKETPPPRSGYTGDLDTWSYEKTGDTVYPFIVRDYEDRHVALVKNEDDARRISKTPQLYREIRDLVMSYPHFDTSEEINGGIMVEHIGSQHERWKKLVEDMADKELEIDEETGSYKRFL